MTGPIYLLTRERYAALLARCRMYRIYTRSPPLAPFAPLLQDWTVPLGHRYAATLAQCNWVPGEVKISIHSVPR